MELLDALIEDRQLTEIMKYHATKSSRRIQNTSDMFYGQSTDTSSISFIVINL